MASWVLVPSLVSLRDEFNTLSPGRDKTSDGSLGDAAHADESSDHNPDETGSTPYEDADSKNEVHAIDVDKDLRRSGWTMAKAVGIIVTRHRQGLDDRLQNVIYSRVIYSASWGWTGREYTGKNAHTEHGHFSARYTTAQENSTRAWGLLGEEDMALTDGDKAWLKSLITPTVAGVRSAVTTDDETREALTTISQVGTREGVVDTLWLAVWAKRHRASLAAGGPGDPTYLDLDLHDQARANNAWDLMKQLGLTQLTDPPMP